jgi:hypothetical protein
MDCGWLGDLDETLSSSRSRKEIMDDEDDDDSSNDHENAVKLPDVSLLNMTCTTDGSFSDDYDEQESEYYDDYDHHYPVDEGEEVALSKAASAIIDETIAKAAAADVSAAAAAVVAANVGVSIQRNYLSDDTNHTDHSDKMTRTLSNRGNISSSSQRSHVMKEQSSSLYRQDPPTMTTNPPSRKNKNISQPVIEEDGSLTVISASATLGSIVPELQSQDVLQQTNTIVNNDSNTTLPPSSHNLDYGDLLVQQADKNDNPHISSTGSSLATKSNDDSTTSKKNVIFSTTTTSTTTTISNNNNKNNVPDGYPSDEEHGFGAAHRSKSIMIRRQGKGKNQSNRKCIFCAVLLLLLVGGGIAVAAWMCLRGNCTMAHGEHTTPKSQKPAVDDTDDDTPTIPTSFSTFETTQELYNAVDQYYNMYMTSINQNVWSHRVAQTYGYPIGIWDVSRLTNFSRVFDPQRSLDLFDESRAASTLKMAVIIEDLSGWDVTNAKTMYGMFAYSTWNVTGLSSWNISRVEDLRYAFYRARYFADDLCEWGWSIAQQTQVSEMFVDSACTNTSNPAYLIFGPMGLSGPWCENCAGQFGMST